MNKKIKIIELLNKIANNEKLPVKIMFNTVAWKLMEDEKDYISTHTQERLLKDDNWILRHLNVEVEILEDEEIEEIKVDDNNYIVTDNGTNLKGRAIDRTFVNKINEIIKKVNELDKKINKED